MSASQMRAEIMSFYFHVLSFLLLQELELPVGEVGSLCFGNEGTH